VGNERGVYRTGANIVRRRVCEHTHLYYCTKATLDPVQDVKVYIRSLLLIFLTLVIDGAELLVIFPCR
jgi:hypothetical protein